MKNSTQLILKKVTVLVLVFTTLLSLSFCSSQGNEEPTIFVPTNTDISVSTSESLLTWIEGNDLIQKLDNSISYNYGDALQNQTEKSLVISGDSTSAIASINFKQEFSNLFSDTNSTNNSVTITLEKEIIKNNAVILKADGPGSTYDLITSILAPGYDPIEVPDCNHAGFGNHIDEVFDSELNENVFRFYIHTTPDNDRCLKFDRQRNEIKTYDKSPDNLLGIESETVVYKWLFKLPQGFQSSPNFTHLHQLKSVGGDLDAMPMYTLTARKGSPDRLELRYAETDTQITLKQTELAPLIDVWLEVTETITYSESGTYEISINKVNDGTVLFEYANNDIVNWRPEGSFVRPKWGIYRSLLNAQDLRDEIILFANFSVEEL